MGNVLRKFVPNKVHKSPNLNTLFTSSANYVCPFSNSRSLPNVFLQMFMWTVLTTDFKVGAKVFN